MNAPARPCILQLQDLDVAYPGQPALASGWSATLGTGVTQIYGDTGSGKSTLLRVMAGAQPASGRLTLAGTHFDESPDAYRRAAFWHDPTSRAFEQMTARECTVSASVDDAGFDESEWLALVEGFALTPHLDKPLYMLSTGSRRKVWLAAALASGRTLILLDEPASALDTASVGCLWNALARAAMRSDRAVVVASAERIDRVALAGVIELPLR